MPSYFMFTSEQLRGDQGKRGVGGRRASYRFDREIEALLAADEEDTITYRAWKDEIAELKYPIYLRKSCYPQLRNYYVNYPTKRGEIVGILKRRQHLMFEGSFKEDADRKSF